MKAIELLANALTAAYEKGKYKAALGSFSEGPVVAMGAITEELNRRGYDCHFVVKFSEEKKAYCVYSCLEQRVGIEDLTNEELRSIFE